MGMTWHNRGVRPFPARCVDFSPHVHHINLFRDPRQYAPPVTPLQVNKGVDSTILLRDVINGNPVEIHVPLYSPLVQSIEVK